VDLEFEGLVVLALDLKFGLQFFHEELEVRDFGAELQCVGAGDLAIWRLRRRLRAVAGLASVA
jgi:hypothetical protein